MSQKRDIELLFELGQLRRIDRMWRRFFQSEIANLADHIFRVVWIALLIAKKEGKKVNEEKIMKMALLHDIPESRTGDVDYIARQYVDRKEKMAISDMLRDTSLEKEFLGLWNEYEKKESIEAKIVKDADALDVDLEIQEQIIQTISKKWISDRKKHVKPRLFTKTARFLWDAIHESNCNNWHINGRNRFNAGDLKNNKK
jgi:putative hydrolases of HD superfamily